MISVIVSTYNRSNLVVHAIESVLAQSFTDIEVIVVDDGSTDLTDRVLEKYTGRVQYLKLTHGGLPAIARNQGLRVARGEFIAFLDDDDTWHPDKLKKQMEWMVKMNARASCSNADRVSNGRQAGLFFQFTGNQFFTLRNLLMNNKLITSSVVLHRSIINKIGYFPEAPQLKATEDYAYWLRAAVYTPFYYLDEPLVKYTDNPSQSLRSKATDEYTLARRVMINFGAWCLGKFWMPRAWRALIWLLFQHGRKEYFWYRDNA